MPYAAVAIGGFTGACLRFLISEWIGTFQGFPTATLMINIVGSFCLAWLYTLTITRIHIHPTLRLGIGTGFIGSFTTFSTFTVETWQLFHAGLILTACLYIAASFIGGIGAAILGYWIANRQSQLRFTESFSKEA